MRLISFQKAKEVKEKIDAAGLTVWSIGSPIGKIDLDGDIPAHFKKLKHTLEIANILGAKNIRLFSFYIPKGKNPDDYTDKVIELVKEMVEICKLYGVNACHENEKGIFGDNVDRCLKLYKSIPDLKGIFDFANFIQCGVDTFEAWKILKKHIYYIHIKDSLTDGTVVTAGDGIGEIFSITKDFVKSGGKNFTVEPHLSIFDGFSDLEKNDNASVIKNSVFSDCETAFDAACDSFKTIVSKIEAGQTVKLGIIGIGNMGSGHAMNIFEGRCPEIQLVAVADRKQERIAWGKESLKTDVEDTSGIAFFDRAEDMLNSGLIDACLIAVPHYEHPRYAIECMKKGIHVIVEKPAGVYTKQVKEMNAEAAKHPEIVFGMMFNQRTNCVYKKMKELVDSGKYGRIRRTNWLITNWYRSQAYYDSGDWRATWKGEGGGVLLNQCPHQLDLWQWICGMPKKVDAHLHYGLWHDIEVEDDVTAYVEYENGATGVFITSIVHRIIIILAIGGQHGKEKAVEFC